MLAPLFWDEPFESSAGYFDFNVGPRRGKIHSHDNAIHVSADNRPCSVAENQNCEPPSLQILLVPEILVRSYEDIESRLFSNTK